MTFSHREESGPRLLRLRWIEAAQIVEKIADFGWLEREDGHRGMPDDDPFRKGLREIIHIVALRDGAQWWGRGKAACPFRPDRMAPGTKAKGQSLPPFDRCWICCKRWTGIEQDGEGDQGGGSPPHDARFSIIAISSFSAMRCLRRSVAW